ncbi:MAG: DNA polymerase III subunit delta [Bacilli bacterium]
MIYLLYGKEEYLLDKETKKLLKNEDPLNINTLSMNNDRLEDIIEDFQTISMFSDEKIVVVKDSYVFSSKKCNIDQDVKLLESYLENINPSTKIIFLLNEIKLDERKKIVKQIRKIGTIKEFNKTDDIFGIVKEMFGEYQIELNVIKTLIDRVGDNLEMLNSEINKIKIYAIDKKEILEEDIVKLTSKNIEADMFVLIDYIINKDKKNAIITLKELIKNNEEPIVMIISLANKLRMIYQTKEFYKKGYTDTEIASILGVKPGYLYYMKNSLNKYESDNIIDLLEKLADLDYKIKSGEIEKNVGLELFVLTN